MNSTFTGNQQLIRSKTDIPASHDARYCLMAYSNTSTFLLCIRLLPIPFELAVSSSFGFSLNIPGRHI